MLNIWNTNFGAQLWDRLFPAMLYLASFPFPMSIRWNVSQYSVVYAGHGTAFCFMSLDPFSSSPFRIIPFSASKESTMCDDWTVSSSQLHCPTMLRTPEVCCCVAKSMTCTSPHSSYQWCPSRLHLFNWIVLSPPSSSSTLCSQSAP
jgi:hypothetical protein